MAENKVETKTYSAKTVERRASPISYGGTDHDEVFHATQSMSRSELNQGISPRLNANQDFYSNEFAASAMGANYQRRNSDVASNTSAVWESLKRASSNNALDQLVGQQQQQQHYPMPTDMNQYPINEDPCPEQIRRHNDGHITYRQDVAVRYLQPPTPPPPGPVIIREVRAPQVPQAPPLVIHQRPPVPVTPPPIVIRERPPVPPLIEPPRIVNRYLPAPPPPARRVIVERQAPLPAKPQPVIIEKWLPYRPQPERRVVVERAQPLMPIPRQKNTIITYDPPCVDIVKNVRNLGVIRVDPHMYASQYGAQLSSSDYVLNTMSRFGVGNNYGQAMQMRIAPHPPSTMFNQMPAINDGNTCQSMAYGQNSAMNMYRSQMMGQNGGHYNYIEEHIDETTLPDGRRHRHSSISGSNEQEVLRQASVTN